MPENLSLDNIALRLTTALMKTYGRDLFGQSIDSAIPNAVRNYIKVCDELKKQMKEHYQR